MKQLYEEHYGAGVFHPLARTTSVQGILRVEFDSARGVLLKRMGQDGADQRHYLWTVHELPIMGLAYRFKITAERHPDDIIERINEQIKIDKELASNEKA